jgi:hypothetical protein
MIKRFALCVLVCQIVFVSELPSRSIILIHSLSISIIQKTAKWAHKKHFLCTWYIVHCTYNCFVCLFLIIDYEFVEFGILF